MFCRFCGRPTVRPDQAYCTFCGAPIYHSGQTQSQKKKKGSVWAAIGRYFLSLLKSGGYYLAFAFIPALFIIVYELIVMATLPDGATVMSDAFRNRYYGYINWAMVVAYALTIACFVIFFALRKKKMWDAAKIRKTHIFALPSAWLFGLGLQIAAVFIIGYMSAVFPDIAKEMEAQNETYALLYQQSSVLSQFVMVAVATPIMEELVFRGFIYNTLKKGMPGGAALVLSAIIFGAAHGNVIQFVYAGVLGLVLAILYDKYESLWVPVMLHAGFNSASFIYNLLNMQSFLATAFVMLVSAGLTLIFISYFFVSKPIYKNEETINENL